MEAIEQLKKIGVKEINKTTKISVGKIEDILEKRFSNIQRVRAVGFLKILENEYRVDLSDWLKEYDESFLSDMTTPDVNETSEHIVHNFDFDTQKRTDDLIEERKKQLISKKRFYLSLVAVLLVLGVYFIYKNLTSDSQDSSSQENPQGISNTLETTPDEQTQNLDSDKSQSNQDSFEQNSSNQDISNQTSLNENSSKKDFSKPDSEQNQNTIQTSQSTQAVQSPEVNTQNKLAQNPSLTAQSSQANQQDTQQIVVVPNKNLWIEVIDLNTQEKTETITERTYTIKAQNHDLLISFGHGDFSLQTDKGVESFNKPYPMRFLYTPQDGVQRIKYSKFLQLSGKEQ